MFRYRFECEDENLTRSVMATMQSDSVSGLFGSRIYDSGIHFTSFGKKIKGFYTNESEFDDTPGRERSARSSPIRVCFTGRFVNKNGKCFFELSIYPRLLEVFLILGGYGLTAVVDWTAFAFATVLLLLISFFYLKNIIRCAEEFEKYLQ